MEQSYMSLFIGAILGAVVCFFTILAVNLLKKQSSVKISANREKIMHQIGELCAEIDSLITSNKEGILNNAGIQTALRKKNDEIIRLLKPNMHILDVYFVKYMDYVQKDYQKYLTASPADPEVSSLQSKSIAFSFESKADFSKQESHQAPVSPRTGSVEQDLHALENAFFKEPAKDIRKKTLETIFAQPKDEVSEVPAAKTEKSFFSDDMTADEFFESKSAPAAKSQETVKPSDTPEASVKAKAEEPVAEEDFTMETIMDLDISKIHIHKTTPLHDFSKKTEPKKTSITNVEEFFEQKNGIKTEPVLQDKEVKKDVASDVEPKPLSKLAEEKVEGPINSVPASSVAELKPKPVLPKMRSEEPIAVASTPKKDINITGDDVADKIDAFFGIDNK
jgi:hypothetical protein